MEAAIIQWLGLLTKVARWPIAASALVSGFLLFAPTSLLEFLGLRQAFESNRALFGLLFLVAIAILVVDRAHALWEALWPSFRYRRKIKWFLQRLTGDEKEYLRPFILEGETTVDYSLEDGVAVELCAKQILFHAQMGTRDAFAHMMQPKVREYLLKHQELLMSKKEKSVVP